LSSKAKVKGTRIENEIVALYKKEGYDAYRQPMSGAIVGFPHDVIVKDLHEGTNIEVKARKNGEGFTQLERWKGNSDILILKRDRTSPMVVMDWELYRQYLHDIRPKETEGEEAHTTRARPKEIKRKIWNSGWQTGHIKAKFPKQTFRYKPTRQKKIEESS
tara:strand:- start:442 stop:924 length:483 start_codon:yes stop_codon:yes gene_type:complete